MIDLANIEQYLTLIPGYDPYRDFEGYWFDADEARLRVEFFHELLTHTEGSIAGQPFILEPWEVAVIANLFGWKNQDGYRRYREVFIYVPRKNGKTPLVAGIALSVLFSDGEERAQCVISAGDREQASKLFAHCVNMCGNKPDLQDKIQTYRGYAQMAIKYDALGSELKVISADASNKHGGNLHLAIIDELHVQPNRDLVDVLKTGMASVTRKQPLLVYITTADYDKPSICNETYDRAVNVRDGVTPNPKFLPVIFEAPKDADWKNERTWEIANPNIDVSVSRDFLRDACQAAQETPAFLNTFLRLHLNIRTGQDIAMIPLDDWDGRCVDVDPVDARAEMLDMHLGHACGAGLDIGAISDFTSLVLAFPCNGGYDIIPYFWIPEDSLKRRSTGPIDALWGWAHQGFIKLTPGNVCDYDTVKADIVAIAEQYSIAELAIDSAFQGLQISTQLLNEYGLPVVKMPQGLFTMTAPCKFFLELITGKKLNHAGNPVLRWMAGNAQAKTDDAGRMMPDKKRSSDKIDGIVASIMAIDRAVAKLSVEEACAYESGGVFYGSAYDEDY